MFSDYATLAENEQCGENGERSRCEPFTSDNIAVPGKVIQTQGHDMKDENRQRQRHRGKRRQQKSLDIDNVIPFETVSGINGHQQNDYFPAGTEAHKYVER